MHCFREGTFAAHTVVSCSVEFHIFSLAGFTVYVYVIEYDVTIAAVVVEFNLNVTSCVTGIGIVGIVGGEVPIRFNDASNEEIDMLTTGYTAGAYNNIGA